MLYTLEIMLCDLKMYNFCQSYLNKAEGKMEVCCLIFTNFGTFQLFFFFISTLIPLWSKSILYMISSV